MLGAIRFGDPVPCFSQCLMKSGCSMGQRKVDVKMWYASGLKFKNPEIMDTVIVLPNPSKKGIEVPFNRPAVRCLVVVGQTELTNEVSTGIASDKTKP